MGYFSGRAQERERGSLDHAPSVSDDVSDGPAAEEESVVPQVQRQAHERPLVRVEPRPVRCARCVLVTRTRLEPVSECAGDRQEHRKRSIRLTNIASGKAGPTIGKPGAGAIEGRRREPLGAGVRGRARTPNVLWISPTLRTKILRLVRWSLNKSLLWARIFRFVDFPGLSWVKALKSKRLILRQKLQLRWLGMLKHPA